MTPPRPYSTGLGYESPTEHTVDRTVTSAMAASHLFHRLNELQQTQRVQNAAVDNLVSKVEKTDVPKAVGIRDRIACFQWTWFTSTMATGGVANVLATGEITTIVTAREIRDTTLSIDLPSSLPVSMALYRWSHLLHLQRLPVLNQHSSSSHEISSTARELSSLLY